MIFADYPGHFMFLFLCGIILLAVYTIFHFTVRPVTKTAKISCLLTLIVLSVLVFLLLEPSGEKIVFKNQTPSVSVFIDTSESMSVRDSSTSRFEKAKSKFENILLKKYKEIDWRLYGFDYSHYRVNETEQLKPDGNKTNLASLLKQIQNTANSDLTGAQINAAFIFTDACTINDSNEFTKLISDIPVNIIDVSENKIYPDIEITNVICPTETFQDASYDITLFLKAKNYAGKTDIYIHENDTLKQIREVSFAEQNIVQHTIKFANSQQGLNKLVVRAKPLKDEIDLYDNDRTVYVQTIPAKNVNILFYTEKLNFDIGKIKETLLRHNNIELDLRLNVLKEKTDINEALTNKEMSFPDDKSELDNYDLILFGPVNFTDMNEKMLNNIVSFVSQKGGGATFLPARDITHLSAQKSLLLDIMPVYFKNVNQKSDTKIKGMNKTDAFESDFYDTKIIPVPPYDHNIKPKPASKVLINDNEKPIVVFHRYGNGYVCYINTFQLYQAYDHTSIGGGDLGEIFAYLIPIITSNNNDGYELTPQFRQTDLSGTFFADALLTHQNKPVNDAEVIATMNDKTFLMDNLGKGLYQAKINNVRKIEFDMNFIAGIEGKILTQKSRKFSFTNISDEMDNLSPDKDRLKKLCRKINANYIAIDKMEGISYNYINKPLLTPVRTEIERIWDRWPVLVFICGLLSTNWFIRKRYL